MKFAIKLCDDHDGQHVNVRWDYYDDPRVTSQLDAFAYGKVVAEYWNNDLRPGEYPMKVLNAMIVGPGRKRQPLITADPRQLDWLPNPNRKMPGRMQ